MRKTYLSIGSARKLDIRVIYDNQIIYEGPVDDAPNEIRQLSYYDVSFQSDKVEFFVEAQ